MLATVLVFLGGGLGSVARYLITTKKWLPNFFWGNSLGTLLVNIIGSALLGFALIFYRHHILALAEENTGLWKKPETWQRIFIPLIFVGFCGGFTTFSSYIMDVYTQFLAGHFGSAWLLLVTHVLLGLAAAGLGIWLALRLSL